MDPSVAQLKAELAELKAEREQSESVFTQLERQFHDQQEEVSSVRADRDRLSQANRALGKCRILTYLPCLGCWTAGSSSVAESQLDAARKDAAESQSRADEARAAAHRLELAARSLQEERDSASASTDLKQREVDRLSGELALPRCASLRHVPV